MPKTTIQLVGNPTTRGWSTTNIATKDQIYKGVVFEVVPDYIKKTASISVKKRPGTFTLATPAAGNIGTSVIANVSTSSVISAFGATTSTIYHRALLTTTNCGALDTNQVARHMAEVVFSGVTYTLISACNPSASATTSAWYVASDAVAASTTFTGNRTSGSPIVTSVSSIAGLHVGQLLSATGFTASARILSIDSATQITVNENASSGAPTNTTFTRSHLAKIIDADFPSSIAGDFQELDGTLYIMTQDGRVFGSNINTPDTWTANNYFPCDSYTDGGIGLAKLDKYILAFGSASCEVLYNAGNSSGSLLARQRVLDVGASLGASGSGYAAKALIATGPNWVAWVSNDAMKKVYLFDGELKDITNYALSSVLSATANSVHSVGGLNYMGDSFIHISASASGPVYTNLLYSTKSGMWTDAAFPSSWILEEGRLLQGCAVESTLTNGSIYYISNGGDQDSSSNFTITLQTEPNVLNEGKGFTINSIELISDTQASGNTGISLSGDDYASFSTARNVDMSQTRKKLFRFGRFRNHVIFKLTHSENTPWRAQVLLVDWSPCVT